MNNIFYPPYHAALNQKKEIALGDVIGDNDFANTDFNVEGGELRMSKDGRVFTVKVADQDLGPKYFQQVDSFFTEFVRQNERGITLHQSDVKSFFATKIQEKLTDIQNVFDQSAYNKIAGHYGLDSLQLKKSDSLLILDWCNSVAVLNNLFIGESDQYLDLIKGILIHRLQSQEDAILSSIPKEVFNDPQQLRSSFCSMLKKKGLSYEQAVGLFDRNQAQAVSRKDMNITGCYVLAKLIAQTDVWNEIRKKPGGKHFPFKDVWRFYIDGDKEGAGAYRFETEPFYMLSSLRGMVNILLSKGEPSRKTYYEILQYLRI